MSQPSSDFDSIVKAKFQVKDTFQLPDEEVEYKVVYDASTKQKFVELRDQLEPLGLVPTLYGSPQDALLSVRKKQEAKSAGSRIPVLLLLLSLTSVGVFAILEDYLYADLAPSLPQYAVVLSYSASVVAILAAYEFGRRFAAERVKMQPGTPYFVPGLPNVTAFLPSLGIVSSQKGPAVNREALFEAYLFGPLAALAVALVLYFVGEFAWVQSAVAVPSCQLTGSYISVCPVNPSALQMVLDAVTAPFSRSVPAGFVKLSPIQDAAYVGFLLTFINLLPVIRLDGGNLFGSVFGEGRARIATYLSVAALILIDSPNYWAIAIYVLLIAGRPATLRVQDELSVPSGTKKVMVVLLLILAFLCLPIPQNLATLPLG